MLDRVPHWNPHLNTEIKTYGSITKRTRNIVILDIATALLSGIFIASQASSATHSLTILLASFAAVSPDVVEGPYFFLKWRTKLVEKWIKFQKSIQSDASPLFGLSTQVATVMASFWWIFN